MASAYYYLVGSLPYLKLGEQPLLNSDSFFDMCENFVSPKELEKLKSLSLVPSDNPGYEVETAWNEFETDLRNWSVRIRSQRLQRDGDNFLRPEGTLSGSMELHVTEALDQKTPLEAERRLDDLRWQQLENLEVGHQFDFQMLLIYRLKLAILEKWGRHDSEQGLKHLNDTVVTLQDNPENNGNIESENIE